MGKIPPADAVTKMVPVVVLAIIVRAAKRTPHIAAIRSTSNTLCAI